LAYVYQLKEGKQAKAVDFKDLPIPKEMQVDEVPTQNES